MTLTEQASIAGVFLIILAVLKVLVRGFGRARVLERRASARVRPVESALSMPHSSNGKVRTNGVGGRQSRPVAVIVPDDSSALLQATSSDEQVITEEYPAVTHVPSVSPPQGEVTEAMLLRIERELVHTTLYLVFVVMDRDRCVRACKIGLRDQFTHGVSVVVDTAHYAKTSGGSRKFSVTDHGHSIPSASLEEFVPVMGGKVLLSVFEHKGSFNSLLELVRERVARGEVQSSSQ